MWQLENSKNPYFSPLLNFFGGQMTKIFEVKKESLYYYPIFHVHGWRLETIVHTILD